MSIADKITRLNTAKSGIASAITAKGGTVGASDGFEDFATDIASIPSGGGVLTLNNDSTAGLEYVKSPVFQQVVLPEVFEISLPFCCNFNNMFGSQSSYLNTCWNAKEIIVHGSKTPLVKGLKEMFGRTKETSGFWGSEKCCIERIVLDFDTTLVTNYYKFFEIDSRNFLKRIEGDIDFSSVTSPDNGLSGFNVEMNNLEYIHFVENSLHISSNMSRAVLHTDIMLKNIANCLNESVAEQTISLSEGSKARCQSLIGISVLDPTESFHIWEEDANGDITLSDFITNVKGWTLA